MSRQLPLYQWADTVASRFPTLSASQAFVLALYSFGMVLAHSCGLSAVALQLAPLLLTSDNTVRQRLREFYKPKDKKAGKQRQELDPSGCFSALLNWVLSAWTCRRVALALDVTNLAAKFHVLCVSVLYKGCAIPVAWKILRANTQEAWHPHWVHLLQRLHTTLGKGWQVLVLTDRGLESSRLFMAITTLGWHPLMRAKAYGTFRPKGWRKFYALGKFAPCVGAVFVAVGTAYKTSDARLCCTLLASWSRGHDEAWLLLTDLPPAAADPCWYAFRAWIEQGFKVLKRAGWQWQRTRMTDPARAERLWLAVAVATLWLLAVGGVAEEAVPLEVVPALPEGVERPRRHGPRLHRVFRRGLSEIVAALLQGRLPHGQFVPEAWPENFHEATNMSEAEFCSKQTYP